jgi:hypothetical protein
MYRRILGGFALGVSLTLAGCETVTPSIPPGYAGPTAEIKDSIEQDGGTSKVSIFYVNAIDGKEVDNARLATIRATRGHGFGIVPAEIDQRKVPVRPLKLQLVGRTQHAAPIASIVGTEYEVKGEITFTPEESKTYIVKGILGEAYSAVWLVEQGSEAAIDRKIEVHGSAALGILDK